MLAKVEVAKLDTSVVTSAVPTKELIRVGVAEDATVVETASTLVAVVDEGKIVKATSLEQAEFQSIGIIQKLVSCDQKKRGAEGAEKNEITILKTSK